MKYSLRRTGTRDLCTPVMKNICIDLLPVEPIVRVAWIGERVVTAEVIACTGILEWKRKKNMSIVYTYTHKGRMIFKVFMSLENQSYCVLGLWKYVE